MDNETTDALKGIMGLFGISALAAASRTVLTEDRRSFPGFLRGLVLAAFVGTMVGLLIQDWHFSAPTQSGIVGVTAFVADDILLFIINFTKLLRDDPKAILDWLLRRQA